MRKKFECRVDGMWKMKGLLNLQNCNGTSIWATLLDDNTTSSAVFGSRWEQSQSNDREKLPSFDWDLEERQRSLL